MRGEPQSRADPPAVSFDAAREVAERIGSQPVAAGSPEEKALAYRRARLLGGLTQAQSLSCKKAE
jgi:hypothetical protein